MGWLDKLLGRKKDAHDHTHQAPEPSSMPAAEPPASGGAGGMSSGSSGTPPEQEGADTTES